MPALNSSAVEIWKRRFRRLYTSDLPSLLALSDQIAAEAGETVTITATTLEGGSGTGEVTGNKLEMLAAAEDIIAELDPAVPGDAPRGFVMRFAP